MIKKARFTENDIIVGTKMPDRLHRPLPELPRGLEGIDLHLAQIWGLHPAWRSRFRPEELPSMSIDAKQQLVEEFERSLNLDAQTLAALEGTCKRFSPEEALTEYVRHLLQLHKLFLAGDDQTDEADEIGDRLIAPWKCLDKPKVELVDGLSADLFTIGKVRAKPESFPTQTQVSQKVTTAMEHEDWPLALQTVREHEAELPPLLTAYFRGLCWMGLGQPDVAAVFFEEAVRMQPNQPELENFLLASMLVGSRADEAVARADSIAQSSSDPASLLMAAIVFFTRTQQLPTAESLPLHRCAIEVAQRGLDAAQEHSPDATVEALRPGVYLHMAFSYEKLNDLQAARRACRQALLIDPKNKYAAELDRLLDDEKYPDSKPQIDELCPVILTQLLPNLPRENLCNAA